MTLRIAERSMTSPPSEEDAPLVEWPPPRTARSKDQSLAKSTAEEMSAAEVARTTAPYKFMLRQE